MASKMQIPYIGQECPTCQIGTFEVPLNEQEWHLTCSQCDTVLFCYTPMEHQESFHEDATKFRMYAGGYGSAKTSTCCAEFIRHIYETPGGTGLIGAATLPQLEQTAMKQFFEMFPEEHIAHYSKQKNYVDCVNGFRVIFRPLDDEGKARSLNLTAFWVEESSEVGYEYFVQLQTRLRNHATDDHMGLLSTNPDMGWIKTEFLLKSKNIQGGDVTYHVNPDEVNPNFSTHIAETSKNYHLPDDYYETTAEGKPDWWIRRFLDGSFENREGLVYPQFQDEEIWVDDFQIPAFWERLMAMDFGLRDPTAVLWGAIDPKDGILYLYREHYETNKPVHHHAMIVNKENDKIPAGRLRPPVGDPSGKNRNLEDTRSTFEHYAEYGVYLNEASNKIEDGIMKAYTYLELGKVRVFKSMKWFRWETSRYKYPEKKLENEEKVNNTNAEKPVDKDNHLMDDFKYMVMELPDSPEDLINTSYGIEQAQYQEDHLPHALQDSDPYETYDDWTAYY